MRRGKFSHKNSNNSLEKFFERHRRELDNLTPVLVGELESQFPLSKILLL